MREQVEKLIGILVIAFGAPIALVAWLVWNVIPAIIVFSMFGAMFAGCVWFITGMFIPFYWLWLGCTAFMAFGIWGKDYYQEKRIDKMQDLD